MDSSKLSFVRLGERHVTQTDFIILTCGGGSVVRRLQAQDALPAGPSAFVLIARLHALPGQADQVVAMSAAVDKKVRGRRAGHVVAYLSTGIQPTLRALSGPRFTRTAMR